MTDPEIATAAAILGKHKIRFVVIGGQAVGKDVTATEDVDVMVTTADYAETVPELRHDADLTFEWEEGGVTRFKMVPAGDIRLDVLDAHEFSGRRSGDEFFEFLVNTESSERDGILWASPAAVWYTRPMIRRWKAYAERILFNILGGVGAGRLQRVEEIARRFGTQDVMRERIAYVRAELRRPDLEHILKDE